MSEITLKLDGEAIDARALHEGLGALIGMLKSVSDDGDSAPLIQELRTGSAIAALNAEPLQVERIHDGLQALRRGAQLPDSWTGKTLQGVRTLYKTLTRHGVTGVSISSANSVSPIDEHLVEAVDNVESGIHQTLGTMTGRLYRYSNPPNRGRIEASIENESLGESIPLIIADDIAADARGLLDERVTVRGLISHNPWNNKVTAMDVYGIEISRPTAAPVVTLAEARGLLLEHPEDHIDSVAEVRKLRDETA